MLHIMLDTHDLRTPPPPLPSHFDNAQVRWDASDNAPITQDEMEVAFPEGDDGISSSSGQLSITEGDSDKTLSVGAGSPPQAQGMDPATRDGVEVSIVY